MEIDNQKERYKNKSAFLDFLQKNGRKNEKYNKMTKTEKEKRKIKQLIENVS